MSMQMGNYRFRTFKARPSLYKHGLNYDKQGAIYFTCKLYFTILTEDEQLRFKTLCWECAKQKQNVYSGLFEYLTSELNMDEVCEIYGIGRSNFYRYVDEFYINFGYVKKVF